MVPSGTAVALQSTVTAPRIIVASATTAITRRTTMRKAFLAPWHPVVSKIYLYSLADAQRHTQVDVHHWIGVVDHHHQTVTPERNNLPEFTHRVHRDVSCAVNQLLIGERYDAPRELFDDRSGHYMRLLDAAAQITQVQYERLNCVAAGLVDRPEHMPGDTFTFDLWKRGYLEVERPPVYFSSSRPDVLRLRVTPPPLLLAEFGGDVDRLVYHMKRLCEYAGRELRAARKRPSLGARKIVRMHPWNEPRSLRESGGRRVPTFRIGARGIDGRITSAAAARETHQFRKEYRQAWQAYRSGQSTARFPFGTYAMRVHHDVLVEPEPKPTALVTRPGRCPLEDEAPCNGDSDLGAAQEHKGAHTRLLDQAREAFREEAQVLVDNDEMVFDNRPRDSGAVAASAEVDDEEPARPVIVKHRFDPTIRSRAARIITLRDARRGRPTARSGRSGADPPG